MVSDGYVWCDHFENVSRRRHGKTRRPDFVFERTDGSIAVVEAKGTHSGARNRLNHYLHQTYHAQVSPHLGVELTCGIVTRGYAIGAWCTSKKKAEFIIHHTAVQEPEGDAPKVDERPTGSVELRRGNYLAAAGLLFGGEFAKALSTRTWDVDTATFAVAEWIGRKWLLGLRPPTRPQWLGGWVYPDDRDEGPAWREFSGYALDLEVASRVLRAFDGQGSQDALGQIRPVPASVIEKARENDGAVFPDGLALIGNIYDISPIRELAWNPDASEFFDPNLLPSQRHLST